MSTLLFVAVGVLVLALFAVIFLVSFGKKSVDRHVKTSSSLEGNPFFFHGLSHIEVRHDEMKKILSHLKQHIIGMDYFIHGLLLALLAGGHVLVEGAPGLAKTKTIRLLSSLLALDTKRIQCTPDMLPADLIGVDMFNQSTHSFETFFGPLFTNVLLVDEINRATPKVQSALLEAMQEKQVTIGGTSYPLPQPFFVLATQNPLEQDGTYPLPEAQLDRFIMKLTVDYPTLEHEKQILQTAQHQYTFEHILSSEKLQQMQKQVEHIHVSDAIHAYVAQLIVATRKPHNSIAYGSSPRGSLSVISLAKALAFIEGRKEVVAQDVQKVLLPALRHRLILSVHAQMNSERDDEILFDIVDPIL